MKINSESPQFIIGLRAMWFISLLAQKKIKTAYGGDV